MRALLAPLLALGLSLQALAESPNIILVMADDQGWGDTGYNGHPVVQTPHLDAMARAGLVFDRFYAAAPVCSPTRASVLTGRNPNRTGVPNHGHFLYDDELCIAEVLRDAGYHCGHFGKWHVGSVQAESGTNPTARGFHEWVIGSNFFDTDPYLSNRGTVRQYKGQSSAIVIDETIGFLRRNQKSGKPLFAIAWFSSPHDPHRETPSDPELYAKGAPSLRQRALARLRRQPSVSQQDIPYFLEITALDEQVGRLRAELRTLGMEENTILWYCSDNGGLRMASSGGREKKGSIYEGGLRVPALLEWPARIKPSRSAFPAVTSDMLPTLLALVGVEDPAVGEPLDGIDLSAAIFEGVASRPSPIGFWRDVTPGQSTWSDRIAKALMEAQEAGEPSPHPERLTQGARPREKQSLDSFPGHAAWLDWPWKLHRIEKGKAVTLELYQLVEDPLEASNLAEKEPDRAAALLQGLEEWQRSVARSRGGETE